MGYSCQLMIDDYPILADSNDVNPYIVALFDADDLTLFKRKCKERNRIAWIISEEEEEEEETAAIFENRAEVIQDRLQLLGFTSQRAKNDFTYSKQEYIEREETYLSNELFYGTHDSINMRLEILQEASYNIFLDSLVYIIQNKIQKSNFQDYSDYHNFKILTYLFDFNNVLLLFPHSDVRNILRGLVERLPKNTIIKYDITEHIKNEMVEDDDEPLHPYEVYEYLLFKEELPFEDRLNEKIIVLTEGSSDANILKRSLNLLYPHLMKYYSFMDFDSAIVPGGSGALANYTKSFIGSNIKNRIISLFDNDTAGYAAARPLAKLFIPDNFRILHLPNIELALNYPTLGPTGLIFTDINQSACSIELYFGRDILTMNDLLCPIQWMGFDKGLSKYQGEITEKNNLQQRFNNKLTACESDNTLVENYDWADMKKVLLTIFNAFNT